MKFLKTFLLSFSTFAWISCSEDSVASPKYARSDKPFGWMDAGFTPDPTTLNTRGGGLQKVAHSGDWIVLMDSWISPVDSHPGYSTWTPRLFVSKIGTDSWDTIKPPANENINRIYADSLGIYVGMKMSAQIFQYMPETKQWNHWNLLDSIESGGWYSVYGIARFHGRLVASLAGYENSEAESKGGFKSQMQHPVN